MEDGPPNCQLLAGRTLNAYKEGHNTQPVEGISKKSLHTIVVQRLGYNPSTFCHISCQYLKLRPKNQKQKQKRAVFDHFGAVFSHLVEV